VGKLLTFVNSNYRHKNWQPCLTSPPLQGKQGYVGLKVLNCVGTI
jgi:hypothetical protein